MLQNAACDQDLHCLHKIDRNSYENDSKENELGVPKMMNGLIQSIETEEFISHK